MKDMDTEFIILASEGYILVIMSLTIWFITQATNNWVTEDEDGVKFDYASDFAQRRLDCFRELDDA